MKRSFYAVIGFVSAVVCSGAIAGSGADIPYLEGVIANYDKENHVGLERAQLDWQSDLEALVLDWHETALTAGEFDLTAGEFDRQVENHVNRVVVAPMPQKEGGYIVSEPKISAQVVPMLGWVNEAAFIVEIKHIDPAARPLAISISPSVVTYKVHYSNPWLVKAREQLKDPNVDQWFALPLSLEEARKSVENFEAVGKELGVDYFQPTAKPLFIRRFQTIMGGTTGRIFADEVKLL